MTWRLLEDGSQRACLDLGVEADLIGLMPPWFIEPKTGVMGPVETDLPHRLLRAVLASPVLSAAAARGVRTELARRVPQHAIPPPRELEPPTRLDGTPVPHLRLMRSGTRDGDGPPAWSAPASDTPAARLSFRYGPLLVAAFETRPVLMHEGALYAVERDRQTERDALSQLDAMGFRVRDLPAPGQSRPRDLVLPESEDGVGWLDFMLDELPELRAAGWEVEIAEDFPLRLVQPSGRIVAEVREGSGIDWFELDLGVMVEGNRVDLVPPLLELIAPGGRRRHPRGVRGRGRSGDTRCCCRSPTGACWRCRCR